MNNGTQEAVARPANAQPVQKAPQQQPVRPVQNVKPASQAPVKPVSAAEMDYKQFDSAFRQEKNANLDKSRRTVAEGIEALKNQPAN